MSSGEMVFVFNGKNNWKTSNGEDWDLISMELEGNEKVLGHKKIDGMIFKIIESSDKKIVALSK